MEKKNRYLYYSIFYSCLLLVAIGIYAYGWETPSCDPPGCNLPAPINAGLNSQTKEGNLTIDGLFKIGRYLAEPTGSTGSLYYDTTDNEFKGYKESGWDSLGGGGVWGSIAGTLSSQTDLQNALNGKAPLASPTFTGTVIVPTPLVAGAAVNKAYADTAGSKTAYRYVAHNAYCPTVTGVTERAISVYPSGTVNGNIYRAAGHVCIAAGIDNGCLCLYSSL